MAESKLRKRYYSGVQIVDALCVSCCDYKTQMKVFKNLASADCDDVFEVVRCKDCKYRNGDKDKPYCDRINPYRSFYVGDNDFCSWGEKNG